MFPTKTERLARWQTTRQRGIVRYVIVNGILVWGLITGTLSGLVRWKFFGDPLQIALPLCLLLFSIAGICVGWASWRRMEKLYFASKAINRVSS
jgi:hypothetical protein